jgi:NAD(P)-dependent dehydrogenase (short-subunit alcohol dehydrogenase family)
MHVDLAGRTAVITGGSKGIGLAVASRFADSGAEVAIVARGRSALDDAVKTIGMSGRARVTGIQADVAVAADVRRAYDEVMARFGKIDILVNNAGTSRAGAFEQITDEVWREDFEQKLFAAIRLTRLVWSQMKERRWRVINTLNIGAKAPRAQSAPTSITRAAGLALTKVLAAEGASYSILVNALLVGFIEADQHVRAAEKAGIPLTDYVSARAKEIPLGRIGRAEEFANIACFLASDAASYITGTAINVDGGRSPVV